MKYIAVVGRMHSGKTTFANALVAHGFERMSFADPVKEVSGAMLATFENYFKFESMVDRPPYTIEEMNHKKGHPSVRKLLQLVGTELGREWRGPDTIWIDHFSEKFREKQNWARVLRTEAPVVVDDCRFPNEAEALRTLGFTIVKLIRNEEERKQSVRAALIKDNPVLSVAEVEEKLITLLMHPSEIEVDNIVADHVIGSLNIESLTEDAIALAKLGPTNVYIYTYTPEN